jgi:hypothetical protein
VLSPKILQHLHSGAPGPTTARQQGSTLAVASTETASAAVSISRAVSDLVSANNEIAEAFRSTRQEVVSENNMPDTEELISAIRDLQKLVAANNELTEASKAKQEAVAETKAIEKTAADDLISAIRELQKAVSAPLHITLSRGQ